MAIIVVFQGPTLTKQNYKESIRQLMNKEKAESPSDWPVEGLIAHIAGETDGGFRVIDVWESEEAFRRFGDALAPILKAIGIEGEAEVYAADTIVTA
jgi:hypothetical protein